MPSTAADAKCLRVAVAVITNDLDEILLTRRHPDAHQGGLWEFPGGKFEDGEDITAALVRELREEIGIIVQGHEPLLIVEHDYGDRRVVLDVHSITGFEGQPAPLEGQGMRWVTVGDLAAYPFPAANAPIVDRLLGRDLE